MVSDLKNQMWSRVVFNQMVRTAKHQLQDLLNMNWPCSAITKVASCP